ncbi:hypothetical protein BX070DRAFT_236557 [Coemansia spiralis]|nr:hypothetical protein BX070DRAFT_236557 [Coemansia spiralis]
MTVTKHLHALQLVSAATTGISREIWTMASASNAVPLIVFCVLAAAAFWRQSKQSLQFDQLGKPGVRHSSLFSKHVSCIFYILGTSSACVFHDLQDLYGGKKVQNKINKVGSKTDSRPKKALQASTQPCLNNTTRKAHGNPYKRSTDLDLLGLDIMRVEMHPSQLEKSPANLDDKATGGKTSVCISENLFTSIGDVMDPIIEISQPRAYKPVPIGQRASALRGSIPRGLIPSSAYKNWEYLLWPSPLLPNNDKQPIPELWAILDDRCCQHTDVKKPMVPTCSMQSRSGLSLFTSDVFC